MIVTFSNTYQRVNKKGELEFHKPNLEHRQSSVSAVSVIKCQVITETYTHLRKFPS